MMWVIQLMFCEAKRLWEGDDLVLILLESYRGSVYKHKCKFNKMQHVRIQELQVRGQIF